jgi:8-amino-7-oxononanoate synthase
MDGDTPDFSELVNICQEKNACLIVDEAHSFGVCGDKGSGLIQKLSLENMIFARILTFGKALGCHGAAIAGSNTLIEYLINYCRPFIYTTALPLYSLVFIECAYRFLPESDILREKLQSNVNHFLNSVSSISENFTKSNSQIQSIIIPGNERVKRIAAELQLGGYDVRAILKPSVKTGTERLRISLHSYNTHEQISGLAERLIKLLLLY